jgi:hypothetical protein
MDGLLKVPKVIKLQKKKDDKDKLVQKGNHDIKLLKNACSNCGFIVPKPPKPEEKEDRLVKCSICDDEYPKNQRIPHQSTDKHKNCQIVIEKVKQLDNDKLNDLKNSL